MALEKKQLLEAELLAGVTLNHKTMAHKSARAEYNSFDMQATLKTQGDGGQPAYRLSCTWAELSVTFEARIEQVGCSACSKHLIILQREYD